MAHRRAAQQMYGGMHKLKLLQTPVYRIVSASHPVYCLQGLHLPQLSAWSIPGHHHPS